MGVFDILLDLYVKSHLSLVSPKEVSVPDNAYNQQSRDMEIRKSHKEY